MLVSPYAGWAGSLEPEEIRARLEGLERMGPDDVLPGLFVEGTPQALIDESDAIARETRPQTLRTMIRAFAAADLRPPLPTITVPTLVVHGDRDVRSPPHVAHAIHAAIPGAEIVTLEGHGHVLTWEAPERFAAVVRAFLG